MYLSSKYLFVPNWWAWLNCKFCEKTLNFILLLWEWPKNPPPPFTFYEILITFPLVHFIPPPIIKHERVFILPPMVSYIFKNTVKVTYLRQIFIVAVMINASFNFWPVKYVRNNIQEKKLMKILKILRNYK